MAKDDIDFSEITKAVAEVKTGFEAFKEANDLRIKELAKGVADPLIEEKLSKINADLDKHQETLDKLYASTRRRHLVVDGKEVDPAMLDKKALGWAKMAAKARGSDVSEYTHENMLSYGSAFDSYLRKDDRILPAEELKALSVGSDPDGGYLTSPDTTGRIVTKQYETSPVRQFAAVQVISTDALEGLLDLDEADSGWVGETQARTETGTPQLKVWRIPVHEQYAKPRATQKILDDASIDIEAWLAGKVAEKFARVENAAFVNGDGTGKPRGFLTYPAGTSYAQIEQVASGASGAFDADPDGGDAFLSLIYATKTRYLGNANFFMNRLTTGAARKLKNSDGDYIWQPSMQAGQPSTLHGYPVVRFDDMPNFSTADALAVAFGDLAQCYQIVDRMGIRVLRDPYTAKPFVVFYTTKRVGGDVIDFEALKLMKMATSV